MPIDADGALGFAFGWEPAGALRRDSSSAVIVLACVVVFGDGRRTDILCAAIHIPCFDFVV